MSDFPRAARDTDKHLGEVTRRTVITGVAATAVAATVVTADMPANAQIASAVPSEEMVLFILLSGALTGISEAKLATDFGPKAKLKIPRDQIRWPAWLRIFRSAHL